MDFDATDLFALGIKLDKINYDGFWDWFVKFHPVTTLWELQPTYILVQLVFLFGGIVTLVHALLCGGRWPYLWIATILQGLVVELICYVLPNVDNFWHSQTPVMFFGQRLPLHIILLYPCFYYQATFAASKLSLPLKIQPFAVGLLVILLDIPYDIICVKLVHWTWHDTDPNIYDRHYWVPWNSYFFHTSFAAGFTFWFHYSDNPKWTASENLQQSKSVSTELKSMVRTALLGAPTGILLFIAIYHPFHDLVAIHSEVTFFALFAIFDSIVWRHIVTSSTQRNQRTGKKGYTKVLIPHLLLHYGLFLGLSLFASPEEEVSIGLHEPIGPCNETESMHTAFGMVLEKRKYLCIADYDEPYFDFRCIPGGPPKNKAVWYGICGTPFENRAEYMLIFSIITGFASVIFYTLHFSLKKTNQPHKKKA